MALIYQTEYRLGPRGTCVTRTYGGVRALVAITTDLFLALVFGIFALAFGVVGWSFWLAWHLCRLVVLALRDLIVTLARLVRDIVTLPWRAGRPDSRQVAAKPSLAAFQEL
jgi:hypothetical protein